MGYIYGVKYLGDKTLLDGRSKTLLSSKYCYIGQSVNYLVRWRTEKKEVRNGTMNSVFYDTIRHHGIDKFEWVLLLIVDDESMGQVEYDYIRKYSLHPNGLNLKDGSINPKFTDELKTKLSNARKSWWARLNDKEKELIRLRIKMNTTVDVREKNSKTNLARYQTEEGKAKAKRHSEFMKSEAAKDAHARAAKTKRERNKTPEAIEREKNKAAHRAILRKTPEGIEKQLKWKETMKKFFEERRKLIPKRTCEICDFKNPDNKLLALKKHLESAKHKANEKAIQDSQIILNNIFV